MKFLIQQTRVFFAHYSPYEKVASMLITALVFLLPLFFIPGLALSLSFTKSVFIAFVAFLGVIFYIISRLQKRQIDIPQSPVLLLLWLVPVAYLISSIFSKNVQGSLFGSGLNVDTLSFVTLMTLITSLIVLLVRSKQRIVQIYLALFTSFGVLALFHVSRLLFGVDFLSFSVFTSSTSTLIGSWNDMAIFSGLIAILSLLILSTRAVPKVANYLFTGSLLVSLFFLTLINFSTVWWIVGFFALATFVYSIVRRRVVEDTTRGISFMSLIVLVFSLLVLLGGNGMGSYLSEKFNTQYFDVRPSWSSTVDIGKVVYAERSIFGAGPNMFEKEWLLNKPAGINNTVFWDTNFNTGVGFIPTSFITTGLIGMIAWTLFYLSFLFFGFRALIMRTVEDRFSYHVSLGSFLAALYLWTLVTISASSVSIVAFAFIFTGIFIVSLGGQRFTISLGENPRLGFVAVFILTIVFLASIAGLFGLSGTYLAAVSHEKGIQLATTDLSAAQEKIERATKLHQSDEYFRSLTEINLIALNQLITEADTPSNELQEEFQALVGEAVGNAQTALQIDGTSYLNWLQLGRVYQTISLIGIEGAYENAVRAYDGALMYSPHDPSLYLRRAELEFATGNSEVGKEYIGRALEKKNNYTAAIFLLTQVQIEEGNVADAIVSAEALTIIDPNNQTAHFQLGLLQFNSNETSGAILALERAVSIDPDYSNARYFLGLAYYKAGRVVDSIEQFKEVQKRNPENVEMLVIIDNLQKGKSPIEGIVEDLPITNE